MAVRRLLLALLFVWVVPGPLRAQTVIRGVVLDSTTRVPLDLARVVAASRSTLTDRFGRFLIVIDSFPTRLLVTRIGSRPVTLDLETAPADLLWVALPVSPVQVADLVVGRGGGPDITELGRWTIPLEGGALLPMAHPDVMRALVAAPAVTQSTIISARPLVRGYDPGEATLLLDGFELPNPYHLARAFSAIPVEGVERVTVATAPLDVSVGHTSGAAIDLVGRTGDAAGPSGGVAIDPISVTGWSGGTLGGAHLFGATRVVTVGALATLAGKEFAYGFNDGYGSVLVDRGGAPWLRGSVFGSNDRVESSQGDEAMSWGVGLVGARVDLWRRGDQRVEVSAFASDFHETIEHLGIRSSIVNVDNDNSRIAGSIEWSGGHSARGFRAGLAPAWRRIRNRVVTDGGALLSADLDDARTEFGAYASWSGRLGSGSIDAGLRYDVAGEVNALQPRLRAEWPLGRGWAVGGAVGRSARLYHAISDPHGEPELVFYDLWFVAGVQGIPVARVDHAMLSASWQERAVSFRAAAYLSRGTGMVEVRPETDQTFGASTLRTGESRTRGLEAQGGVNGGGRSITLTYALTWSERDWGEGWIPWVQDRRHLVRLAAQTGIGRGWRFSTMVEAMSAAPLTPVAYVAPSDPFPGGGSGAPSYVFGREGSARGSGTFRADIGFERTFEGPWGSRGAFTASITNLTFGPAAPIRPEDIGDLYIGPDGPHAVRYERLFKLPAIPSIGLRFEF